MASLGDPRISNPVLSCLKVKTEDKIIFVKENHLADSNFIISHLLKQFLYEKSRICFLILHNTLDHYQHVGKKLGYDLKQNVEKGEVKIIDPLEEVFDNAEDEVIKKDSIPGILDCMYNCIKQQIDAFFALSDNPVCIVIDDISHFLDLGVKPSSLVQFTNFCINMVEEKDVQVVINSHVSTQSDLLVANNLQYVCDLFINVSALKTGQSTDITGLMTTQRGADENRYHFKAFDRGVKTFHPGESIYNLYK